MVGAAAVVVPCRLLVRLGRGRWVPGVVAVALVLGAAAVALVFARILAPGTAGELPVPGVVADWLAANDGDVRRTDWLVAWHIFTQQLPAFAGAGSYQTLWPEARAALSALPDYAPLAEQVPVAIRARNDYLQGLAELGLMGAAWFLALAGALVHALHRRWSRLDGAAQTAFLALVGGVLTVALQALVSSPLHLPAPAFALAGILGVLASGALESGAPPRPRVRLPRVLAAVVLVAGVAVAAAGGREFAGDLAVARGVRLYREGRLSAALVEFERGARRQLWPGDGDLYRGLTLAALGRDDEAAAALTASLRHRPRYAGLLGLAELELGRGEFASALARLARVENCRPAAPFRQRVRYLRGMVFLRQERLAAARREFQRLFESAPRDPEGLVAMGELELRAGDPAAARDRYALALAAIEADLQAGPDPLAAAKLERLRDAAQRGLAGSR
jgi:tetratricopeptide (TPR) repeat protein